MIDSNLVKKINLIFHEEEAKSYDSRHPEIGKEKANWLDFAEKYLKRMNRPITILDIGSGTGFVPEILSTYLSDGDKIICTDISPAMLEQAREKLIKIHCQLEFKEIDCEKIPLADNSIDLITVNSVLHHLPDYGAFLKEVRRLLKPNGIIAIMHEPNQKFYQNGILVFIYKFLSYLKSKIAIKTASSDKVELARKVCQKLLATRVTEKLLTPRELMSYVDVWSPTAPEKINKEAGFNPNRIIKEYFSDYKILTNKTYNHLGKLDAEVNMLFLTLNYLLGKIFPQSGSAFIMILRK